MNEYGNYYEIVEKYHPDLHCKLTLPSESPGKPSIAIFSILNDIRERKSN